MKSQKALRIAIYHNLHSGGAKRVVSEHLRELSQQHTVKLFSLKIADHHFAGVSDDGTPHERHIADYQPIPPLPSPFGRLNPLMGVVSILRLDRVLQTMALQIDAEAFDVALVHPCQMTQSPSILRHLKTPSLYFCQETFRRYYEPAIVRPYEADGASSARGAFRRIINTIDPLMGLARVFIRNWDRDNARAATGLVVNSNFTKTNIKNAYGRKAAIAYPGVNASRFKPDETIPRESFVLGVGSLIAVKGFDFIVRALGTLPEKDRPRLVLINNYQEPAEKAYIESLARDCQVEITCLLNVSETELQHWYARAGCVALAPINEPFGLVALEAMAAGAPVVAVAEGGLQETVIPDVTGLVAPRIPEPFGLAIRSLLHNPQRALGMARAGRNQVLQQWTWQRHFEQLEPLLLDLANTKRR